MASGSFWCHCPKKRCPKYFSYLCSRNGNPLNVHPCTSTCHKFTLSPNNLIFKLIMFVGKTRHLYSMIEIKTLKIGKNSVQLSNPTGLLNPKLVVTLPHGVDPKTIYPLPLLSPIHAWIKFPRTHFLSFLWFFLPLLSPLHTWVKFPSTWFPLPLPFPLHKQVEFPLIQFPLPLLHSMHGSSSPPTQFPLTSSISL